MNDNSYGISSLLYYERIIIIIVIIIIMLFDHLSQTVII